jgi:hypothetical protein
VKKVEVTVVFDTKELIAFSPNLLTSVLAYLTSPSHVRSLHHNLQASKFSSHSYSSI